MVPTVHGARTLGVPTRGSHTPQQVQSGPILLDRHIGTLPKAARDLVARQLPQWGLSALVEGARTVAGELVANAVENKSRAGLSVFL
ncbi:hypothetical protein GCM10012280_58640 [Wenjunlia tyrosinilytica]|uniref:Uncharacterized protein n=1 Tax=Wenjunlia tyrosinilytica TaxID=1544741 RepID=A0A918E0I6_9ACTN|nr:hypothetical protein GCM10012280_58640 [Wenjunlia tyrosinilytica]